MALARAIDDVDLASDLLGMAHKHALRTTGWGDARARS
jgi:hypothetical protein